jgi:hypothetical protein
MSSTPEARNPGKVKSSRQLKFPVVQSNPGDSLLTTEAASSALCLFDSASSTEMGLLVEGISHNFKDQQAILHLVRSPHGQPLQAERRITYRYPLELGIDFRIVSGTSIYSGVGRAVNMSSGGVLIVTEEVDPLQGPYVGGTVEMSFEWPPRRDGEISLYLFAVGPIVRRTMGEFAATIERYQFRTTRNSNLRLLDWRRSEPN